MFAIEIYNHENNTIIGRMEFDIKREANKFIKDHCDKRGYDFFSKENRSIEYSKLY